MIEAFPMNQLVEMPSSDMSARREPLGYVEAYDALLNSDYAFVAYKETDARGDWRVRIKSASTAGCVFEPEAMRLKARETSAQGKSWFPWGYSFDPSPSDQRQIQFRVHVANGRPTEVEMYMRLRNHDGSASDAQSVRFPWPAS